jgi:hypothetical protein
MEPEERPSWFEQRRRERQYMREEGLAGPPSFLEDLMDWRMVAAVVLLVVITASLAWGMIKGGQQTRAAYEQGRAHPKRRISPR